MRQTSEVFDRNAAQSSNRSQNDKSLTNVMGQDEDSLPAWVYGTVLAGAVTLSGGAISLWHVISKKKRFRQAEKIVQQNLVTEISGMTPRDYAAKLQKQHSERWGDDEEAELSDEEGVLIMTKTGDFEEVACIEDQKDQPADESEEELIVMTDHSDGFVTVPLTDVDSGRSQEENNFHLVGTTTDSN